MKCTAFTSSGVKTPFFSNSDSVKVGVIFDTVLMYVL
jgi:hypothetical protein